MEIWIEMRTLKLQESSHMNSDSGFNFIQQKIEEEPHYFFF